MNPEGSQNMPHYDLVAVKWNKVKNLYNYIHRPLYSCVIQLFPSRFWVKGLWVQDSEYDGLNSFFFFLSDHYLMISFDHLCKEACHLVFCAYFISFIFHEVPREGHFQFQPLIILQ